MVAVALRGGGLTLGNGEGESVRMTCIQSSLPEIGGDLAGHLPWLEEVLACPACRHPDPRAVHEDFRCPHLQTHFSLRNGIIRAEDEDTPLHDSARGETWEILEKAAGTYDLADDKLLVMPEEEESRSVLDWLRRILGARGPLRILELNARRGWAARALAEDGHQVVAGDVLDDAHIGLGCAVRLRSLTGHRFACVHTDPTALSFLPEAFDCVYSFGLVRQTPDLERVFQEVSRVLRPGGFFLALQEPFRGVLTTQTQRLRDSALYRLARWWLPGQLPCSANPEVIRLRARLGTVVHENRRRVPYCLAHGEAAGLQTTILPTAVALSLPPNLEFPTPADGTQPAWLSSLARAYGLDPDRLRAMIEAARQSLGYDVIPELLNHWLLVGNIDGVLLARKGGHGRRPFPALPPTQAEHCRRLDPLLLACAPDGFLPIYGVYPVEIGTRERSCWIQPEAGLLVSAGPSLDLTVRCPAKPFCSRPVRVEFRLEGERLPVVVTVIRPGKEVALKVPIPAPLVHHASVLVGIRATWGFLPSDFNAAAGCDTRLLAVQLHSVRTSQAQESDVGTILRRILSR